jgi:hypothetical protein
VTVAVGLRRSRAATRPIRPEVRREADSGRLARRASGFLRRVPTAGE